MVKTKYQRMNKQEKESAKEEYFNTNSGKALKPRLNRAIFYGIFLICYGIYLIIDANIKEHNLLQTLYGSGVIVAGFAFLFGRSILMQKRVNDYLTKDKVKKNKDRK
jgi:hypothetical protein